jgi:glycosyltransferase involved in cell wall biosynthesis
MHVLLTTDTVGGVWTYAIDLARALAPHGVSVELATMGAPLTGSQLQEASGVPNVTLHESRFKLEWMQDPWDDVARAGEWLLDLETRTNPDVVHLNGYAHGSLPWQSPVLVVGHSCVLSWWQAVKGEPAPPSWDDYRRAVQQGLRGADVVVAPSAAMLADLQRHYGPLPAAQVIHNGRDARHYRVGEKQEFILSAGRLWDEAKNVAALDTVAPSVPWPIYVAGDDHCPDGNGRAATNVTRLGKLPPPELASWLERASIYALPARYEPFGLSALEAALSGCALVLGDIPSLREVWGDAGEYVPPDDPEALERTLHWLIHKPVERASLSIAARQRATRYTPGRMAEKYLAAYRQLTSPPPLVREAEKEGKRVACGS